MTYKFDELGKERKEKDELINSLQIEVFSFKVEVKNLEKKADDQEQYLRRNCFLIRGVTETKIDNTGETILYVINNELKTKMSHISIDWSHRLEKPKGPGETPQSIIVKFTWYKDKHHVFSN